MEESRGKEASDQWDLQSSLWVSGQSCWFWGNIYHPCPSVRCLLLMLDFVCHSEGKAHPDRRGEGTGGNPLFTCGLCASCSQELLGLPMSKSLLFRATTSQNPIHKFLKYHYKNSFVLLYLYIYLFEFFFFATVALA